MRKHSKLILIYGLFLLAVAGLTAALTGMAERLDRWIVIATGAGGLFALIDFFASRVFRRVMPIVGVRSARIVLIFYAGLLGWLFWRSVSDPRVEEHGIYASVVLGGVFVVTLGVTACEYLLDRTGREFATDRAPERDRSRETVKKT